MREINRTKSGYNPLQHLSQSKDENTSNGWLYSPLIGENGEVIIKDGKVVLVPQMYLNGDTYRDWFFHEYPNGRTEVIRHTAQPLIAGEQIIYPPEVFEVKIFLDSKDEVPATSGFASSKNATGSAYDPVSAALTNAFKVAMKNLGFGVDLKYEDIVKNLPAYIEETTTGGEITYKVVADSVFKLDITKPKQEKTKPENKAKPVETKSVENEKPAEESSAIDFFGTVPVEPEANIEKEIKETAVPKERIEPEEIKPEEKEKEKKAREEADIIPDIADEENKSSNSNDGEVVFALLSDAPANLVKVAADLEGKTLNEIMETVRGESLLKTISKRYSCHIPIGVSEAIDRLL